MKNQSIVFIATMLALAIASRAQEVRIESFHGNGQLSWACPSNSDSTVEWSSSLSETSRWSRTWLPLIDIDSTTGGASVKVPMFYRVSAWTNGLLTRLPIGRTFRFTCTNQYGRSWTNLIVAVGGLTIPAATNNYVLLASSSQYDGDPPAGSDEDGMMMLRSTDKETYGLVGAANEILFWQSAPVGTTWTNGAMVSVIEAIENVSVPAGTFDGCIRIRTDNNGSIHDRNWYKPGFMMVRSDYLFDGNGNASSLLHSWSDD